MGLGHYLTSPAGRTAGPIPRRFVRPRRTIETRPVARRALPAFTLAAAAGGK